MDSDHAGAHNSIRQHITDKVKMMGGLENLIKLLKSNGLRAQDVRLGTLFKRMKKAECDSGSDRDDESNGKIPSESEDDDLIFEAVKDAWHIIEPVLSGTLAVPDWKSFKSSINSCFERAEIFHTGKVASYIPQLSRADPEAWGMSACTVSGQIMNRGLASQSVCVQSCCKPVNYIIALDMLGDEIVHHHVGREPSGKKFNALMLNEELKPHNPLINSGAIMVCALLAHAMKDLDSAERFEKVMQTWSSASGGLGALGFSNSIYLSERNTADRNFALAYFMRETNEHKPVGFPGELDITDVLEFYFQCCSIEVSCETMSVVAGTLANAGVCPVTGQRVWGARHVRNCLSLMQSCGMYDYSGQFGFEIGLPAKSGVSGLVMTVIPGKVGFCTWSPRLDSYGNSVRGVEFCRRISEELHYHSLDSYTMRQARPISDEMIELNQVSTACNLAAIANIQGLRQLMCENYDMNTCDYDKRTPLHIAASNGHLEVVRFLIETCKCISDPVDRWGNTPMDDARRENHDTVKEFLHSCVVNK